MVLSNYLLILITVLGNDMVEDEKEIIFEELKKQQHNYL